ncbi:MAG: hypothetical protein EOO46_14745 [Flavobacterium sp.]|nr:MAG: hypothetical protein EOO46_14745 [Flavobacterium sp.]
MKFLSRILKPKNSVSVLLWVRDVAAYMKAEFKDVDLNEHKFKPSFILHVARVVETDCRDPNCDKKKATLDILRALMPKLSEQDIATIDGIYEDLSKSNRITGPSSIKVLKKACMSYFKK